MIKEKKVNHVVSLSLFCRKNYIIHFFSLSSHSCDSLTLEGEERGPRVQSHPLLHSMGEDKPKVHANIARIDNLVRIKQNIFLKLVIFSFFWVINQVP